jgi:hypothetical protein
LPFVSSCGARPDVALAPAVIATAAWRSRMARRLGDALPDDDRQLRAAVWRLMRPMLSPRLVELNAEAFLATDSPETTVDLAGHRGESSLEDLDLGDEAVVVGRSTGLVASRS